MNRMTRYLMTALFALLSMGAVADVWYVDHSATGTEDGLSWATAFRTIQPAIDAAHADGGGEVWVAEGVYNEARTYIDPASQESTGSIVLLDGVFLYGGFSGSETARDERNWQTHKSVIDGSVSRNDSNAYHVLIMFGTSGLDGVTVTGGFTKYTPVPTEDQQGLIIGAGIYGDTVSPTIRNCSFIENSTPDSKFTVIALPDSDVHLQNCSFVDNLAGAVIARQVRVTKCFFSGNQRLADGIIRDGSDTAIVEDSVFLNNTAYSILIGSLVVRNCIFANNSGADVIIKPLGDGGSPSNPVPSGESIVVNCTFYNNNDEESDILIEYANMYEFTIKNNIFAETAGLMADETATSAGTRVNVYNNLLPGGTPWLDGYPPQFFDVQDNIESADPLFVDAENGDFRLDPLSPCVDGGRDAGAPTSDIEGKPRPQGAATDMGAHEDGMQTAWEDVNKDGVLDASDIQMAVNAVLGTGPMADANGDGSADATDVQLVINAVLGA